MIEHIIIQYFNLLESENVQELLKKQFVAFTLLMKTLVRRQYFW